MPVVLSFLLGATMVLSLRRFVSDGSSVQIERCDAPMLVGAVAMFSILAAVLGPIYGISLLLGLFSYEAGQVMAYRMVGHLETRFRILPILNPRGNSDLPLRDDAEILFVSLMAPAFAIAPTLIAASLYVATSATQPELAEGFRIVAVTMATLNAFLLMPFAPLNGGRCVRILSSNFWPTLAPFATIAASTALLVAGLSSGSIALMIVAAAGLHSLAWGRDIGSGTMPRRLALVALSAYGFSLATFVSCANLMTQVI